ncbi:CTP synthetase [Aliishimia ponticola]|uniref:CTP synthetase n=1 Tax=Aliishimia ponticola TaxID=2499833 RepID=A0A4S4NB34_9RHOB|nr:CTP synthetase [Aliishimia ponticola]THH35181.1 CTP synthetase [Aliishimia ponticola]
MPRLSLMLVLHIFIGSTLAGSGVIIALVSGYATLMPILVAAVLGFILAFPASWFVAKQIDNLR